MSEGKLYFRYFRIESEEFKERIEVVLKDREVARLQIVALVEAVGAEDMKLRRDGLFAGFNFKQEPCQKTFRLAENGFWVPRKNTKVGKELWTKIKSLKKYNDFDTVLTEYDLYPNIPVLIEGRTGYSVTMGGFPQRNVWFVKMPWRDFPTEQLEKYKQDREAGTRMCAEFDHVLCTPPPFFEEIKEWEYLKEWEEISESLKRRTNNESA